MKRLSTHIIRTMCIFSMDSRHIPAIFLSAYLPSLWRKPSSNVAGFLFLRCGGERP